MAASVRFLFFTKHFVRLQTGMKSYLPQLRFQKQSPKVFCKRGILLKFAKFGEKNTTDGVSYQPATLQKKTPAWLLSCEFSEIFNTTYYEEHSQAAASVFRYKYFVRIKAAIITTVAQSFLLVLFHNKKRNLMLT